MSNRKNYCGSVILFFTLSAFFLSISAILRVDSNAFDIESALNAASILIGVVALATTATMVVFSTNIYHIRREVQEMHKQCIEKVETMNSLHGMQTQLMEAFYLVASFADVMAEAINDGVEEENNGELKLVDGEAEKIRHRLFPIRHLMQAMLMTGNNDDKIGACFNAVGCLEALGEFSDVQVCEFAKRLIERMPLLAKVHGAPLTEKQAQRLRTAETKLMGVLFKARNRESRMN